MVGCLTQTAVGVQISQGMKPLPEKGGEERLKAIAKSLPMLSKELVRNHSAGNLIFVTCASWGYLDFALNWVNHLRNAGVHNFLIGEQHSLSYQKAPFQAAGTSGSGYDRA